MGEVFVPDWWEKNVAPKYFLDDSKDGYNNPVRQFIYKIMKEYNPSTILDIPCGTGVDYRGLMKNGILTRSTYIGLDGTEKMVLYAKNRCPEGDFRFGYIQKIPFPDNSFDLVLAKDIIEHLPDGYTRALAELLRVAKKKVIIAWFIPPWSGPDEFKISRDSWLDKIRLVLPQFFKRKQLWIELDRVPENRYNREKLVLYIKSLGGLTIVMTDIKVGVFHTRSVWEINKADAC